ncbi:receptor-type tyrosine-protein phosphatase alpha [Strongylocentrotus purpuratus]|uniref:protein-tyrosine-phosphatase n=1 Tax=Strongylocentrotus purpuratus TaxID=7668 RepID=A0A7M7P8N8_STRPU|nr:receptor-type tyrosine-protein phosphatase alpha [Strongylocentrotus purpuratus]
MAVAAGGAVGAILLILIIIIVVIIVFRRRRNDSSLSQKENTEDQFQASADFQDTSLEENDYSGHASILNPDQTPPTSTRPKPPVAIIKPSLGETNSLDPDSIEGSPHRSSSKPLATRQPIPAAQFPAFVNKNRHTALFFEEFHDLPGPDIYPQTVAQKEINLKKNRYKNILPYDSARVKLEVIDDIPHSDYFNASYIPSFDNEKAYIASQGPNAASMDDFWRMVWQENVTTIAMVTKLQEGDKIKCRQYWPNKQGDSVKFGNFKVELESLEACTGGVKRKMTMRKGDDCRTVTQFHFTEWPDKGVPKHTSSLLKFIKEVKADHGQYTHPLIIHCSAGVGRTGVVISIDSVVAHAKKTRMVDVFNFVTNIRRKRPYMVQTKEQYAFIYGAVLEDLLWRNTLIPVIHFTDHLQDLHTSVDGNGRSKMSKEFQTLQSLCPDPPASQTRSGLTPDNLSKNRYGNNVPLERNRVILDSPEHDYINASYMKGVHCTFMTTQMPLPTTVSDFWSMVLKYKPSTIVMLNDKSQNDKSCAQYWSDDDSAQFGSFSVSTLSTSSDGDMTTRQLKVSRNSKASHTVTQYQFHGWPKHGSDQQSGARSLLKLIRAVKGSTNSKKEFSILVHCLSGAGRTGVLCTAMECIAQVAEGNSVDIFQTVKMLRADRMQSVQTGEEYAFIYDVIREYLHTENYEQRPYPIEDHTYGNVEADYTLDPEENLYEVTDSQDAASAAELVYDNVETERSQDRPKPKPQQAYRAYENFAFES